MFFDDKSGKYSAKKSEQKNYKDFKVPSFAEALNPSQITLYALRYTPAVFAAHEMPEIKVIGISEAQDCIGILGVHPNATLIYHMNEPGAPQLAFALLALAKKTGQLPEVIVKKIDTILPFLLYGGPEYELDDSLRSDLVSAKVFKNVQFTLVTRYTRNVEHLLKFFDQLGIEKNQIHIDLQESNIYIDKSSGIISNQCVATTEKDEDNKNYLKARLNGIVMRTVFRDDSPLKDAFELALLEKDSKKMSHALIQMTDIDRETINGKLIEAAKKGELERLTLLLDAYKQAGLNLNFSDNPLGDTSRRNMLIRSPLIEAITNGHDKIVDLLLTQKINVDQQISPIGKNTALTTAIKYGHKAIALRILKHEPLPIKWLERKNAENLNAATMAKAKGWNDVNEIICSKIPSVSSRYSEEMFKSRERKIGEESQTNITKPRLDKK